MTLKLERVSLRRPDNPEKLKRFFDHLFKSYDRLSNANQRRIFWKNLSVWSERNHIKLFQDACSINHRVAIERLIAHGFYRRPQGPYKISLVQHNLLLPMQPVYYEYLIKSAYPRNKTRLADTPFLESFGLYVKKALPLIPEALQKLILEYAKPYQVDMQEFMTVFSPGAYLALEGSTNPVSTAEEILNKAELGIENRDDQKRRRKYWWSLLYMFLLGLLLAAITAGTLYMFLSGVIAALPVAAIIVLAMVAFCSMIMSGVFSAGFLLKTLVLFCVPGSDRLNSTQAMEGQCTERERDTISNHDFIFGGLIVLASASAILFTIGLIALLPPLALTIPFLLPVTITAGVSMVASSATALSTMSFFTKPGKSSYKKFEVMVDGFISEEPSVAIKTSNGMAA